MYYNKKNKRIELYDDPDKNIFQFEKIDYRLEYLDGNRNYSNNGYLFKMFDAQEEDGIELKYVIRL